MFFFFCHRFLDYWFLVIQAGSAAHGLPLLVSEPRLRAMKAIIRYLLPQILSLH